MEDLENLEDERRKNQNEKIPGKKLPGRVQAKGIANAAAIVGPAILATAVSTGVAVVFCRLMDRRQRV